VRAAGAPQPLTDGGAAAQEEAAAADAAAAAAQQDLRAQVAAAQADAAAAREGIAASSEQQAQRMAELEAAVRAQLCRAVWFSVSNALVCHVHLWLGADRGQQGRTPSYAARCHVLLWSGADGPCAFIGKVPDRLRQLADAVALLTNAPGL